MTLSIWVWAGVLLNKSLDLYYHQSKYKPNPYMVWKIWVVKNFNIRPMVLNCSLAMKLKTGHWTMFECNGGWNVWFDFRFSSCTNFHSPIPRRLHMKSGFNGPSNLRGHVWNSWQWQTMEACLYYKLTIEPFGSDKLKIHWFIFFPYKSVERANLTLL